MSIKKKLKAALLKAGLKEGLADIINITSEDQIEGVLAQLEASTQDPDEGEIDFTKVLASKEFTEFVESNGIEGVLKVSKPLHKEFDKKVTTGIKTFKSKYFKDGNSEGDDPDEGDEGNNNGEKVPEWAKGLVKTVNDLKSNTVKTTKLEEATKLFTENESLKSLPEKVQASWLKRIDLESDTSFEDQIKVLEEEAKELNIIPSDDDTSINTGSKKLGLPTGGKTKTKVDEEVLEDIVGSIL